MYNMKEAAGLLTEEGKRFAVEENWAFSFDEIKKKTGLDLQSDRELALQLTADIGDQPEVSDVFLGPNYLDIGYKH